MDNRSKLTKPGSGPRSAIPSENFRLSAHRANAKRAQYLSTQAAADKYCAKPITQYFALQNTDPTFKGKKSPQALFHEDSEACCETLGWVYGGNDHMQTSGKSKQLRPHFKVTFPASLVKSTFDARLKEKPDYVPTAGVLYSWQQFYAAICDGLKDKVKEQATLDEKFVKQNSVEQLAARRDSDVAAAAAQHRILRDRLQELRTKSERSALDPNISAALRTSYQQACEAHTVELRELDSVHLREVEGIKAKFDKFTCQRVFLDSDKAAKKAANAAKRKKRRVDNARPRKLLKPGTQSLDDVHSEADSDGEGSIQAAGPDDDDDNSDADGLGDNAAEKANAKPHDAGRPLPTSQC